MRLAIAAMTALLLALPARAADDLQTVYAKLHAASLKGDIATMAKFASAAKRAEVTALPAGAETAKLMSGMLPRTYSVTSAGVNPDGKTGELKATGMHALFGPPKPMYGVVKFISEGGAWKVDRSEWSSDKQTASAPMLVLAQAKPAAAPVAAAKPAAPAAAPSADAKRQAQLERERLEKRRRDALVALCVIKPVMSDAEIEKCRAASR